MFGCAFLLWLIVVIGIILNIFIQKSQSANYLETVKISFTGIVTGQTEVTDRVSIIELSLSYTSVDIYDVRDSLDQYLCVIKDKKAEVIVLRRYGIEIGDSVVYNSDTGDGLLHIYQDGMLKRSNTPEVIDIGGIFDKIRKKHKL